MSTSKFVDVWCDVCGNWDDGATSRTAQEARKLAAQHGWKSYGRGLDACPRCIARGAFPTVRLGENG